MIDPIKRNGPVGETSRPTSASKGEATATASKVARFVNQPKVSVSEVRSLARRVQEQWNDLSPGQLADAIVDLEDKVALLDGDSSSVQRIRELVYLLHFRFVFPVALEFSRQPNTFATEVTSLAKQVLAMQSLVSFNELNGTQQYEVLRCANGG